VAAANTRASLNKPKRVAISVNHNTYLDARSLSLFLSLSLITPAAAPSVGSFPPSTQPDALLSFELASLALLVPFA